MERRVFAIAAVVMAAWIGFTVYLRGERAIGAAQQREAVALARADSLAAQARRVDTVYTRDTLRLWKLKERWDTVPVTVEQWKYDTVEVVRYVALADSTIRACAAALLTCEERDRLRVKELAAKDTAYAAHMQTHPSRLKRLTADAVKVLVGVGVGSLIPR